MVSCGAVRVRRSAVFESRDARLVLVVGARHEVRLGEVLGEERRRHVAQNLVGPLSLRREFGERAEQQLHVEVGAERAHLGEDGEEVGAAEALERALRVVHALEHRQQPHADVCGGDGWGSENCAELRAEESRGHAQWRKTIFIMFGCSKCESGCPDGPKSGGLTRKVPGAPYARPSTCARP